MEYIFVVAGLLCLLLGGDWLVKGAIALSEKLNLPAFLISLTVVGFGTSMPELLVSIKAALSGVPGIALGNVVGSNIANILLIIGLSAIITPISATKESSKRDLIVMLLATAVLMVIFFSGTISFVTGALMATALMAYLTIAYFQDRKINTNNNDKRPNDISPIMIGFLLVAGLALLGIGADLLVKGATIVALDWGVSDAVIGLTVVAIGTSLPELATSITAALKRHSDVAVGNVIGSNIFNILGILGLTAIIAPIPVGERFIAIDGWAMLTVTAILCAILYLGHGITRLTGILFLIAYAAYMTTMA